SVRCVRDRYMTWIIKMSADDKLCKLISSNRDEHTHYALIKGTLSPCFSHGINGKAGAVTEE
ncbi:hypothetical protein ACLO89_25500, partial [Escherichia coli]|uniref:hypothetical protein n=1 Tax=Escherichia coli TaxID=562 RepID=UPI003D1BF502